MCRRGVLFKKMKNTLKEKTIKYLENIKKRAEKMNSDYPKKIMIIEKELRKNQKMSKKLDEISIIHKFLKSVGWTFENLDNFLDCLGMAYRNGFIDAFKQYNKEPFENHKEVEKIISDSILKAKKDFKKEILRRGISGQ